MKKIVLSAAITMFTISGANASLWNALGFGKKSEPATLQEACDTDEITKICPDVLLGSQSMTECLKENVSSLSKQCASFVKKSITAKVDAVKDGVADAKADGAEKSETIKQIAADKVQAAKAVIAEKQAAQDAQAQQHVAELQAKKDAAVAAGANVADGIRETGAAARALGESFKNLK